mmetsp:Transcript_29833/g.32490  ORF Transcript_29833/g.32490 Transcript_29833/m.32490 type:complete len:84 (+) Transcript_29833:359-610(+)
MKIDTKAISPLNWMNLDISEIKHLTKAVIHVKRVKSASSTKSKKKKYFKSNQCNKDTKTTFSKITKTMGKRASVKNKDIRFLC